MSPEPSIFGKYIHLFNRGNHKDALFKEEESYHLFLEMYKKYMKPIALLYAYCLLPNHFHLLVKVRDIHQIGDICQSDEMFWYQYRSFLGIYTRRINKVYKRSGCLVNGGYSNVMDPKENSFYQLFIFIHQNPQVYGIVSDYRLWPFSSYFAYKRKDRRAMIAKDLFFDDESYRQIMESGDLSNFTNPVVLTDPSVETGH
jgi:putative transposase